MKSTTNNNKKAYQFFGSTLFIQAVTSLIAGTLFLSPFDPKEINEKMLTSIANSTTLAYTSIILQMLTAVVIVMLGVAMYQLAGHKNKTIALTALSLYIMEATLLVIAQIFTFGLVEISQQFLISGDSSLFPLANAFLACIDFAGKMAMIPFGIGAILFYYLLLKAEVLPKWLALWGIFSAPLILIFTPLMAFGFNIPTYVLIPYIPFEFFTGIYVLIKYRNGKNIE